MALRPNLKGLGWEFLICCPKKRGIRNFCKFLSIKDKVRLNDPLKNVMTARKGLFWGVLAGKQGMLWRKKAFYFALFHVLVVFRVCKLLSVRIFRQIFRFKINRAEKPTVGFWFSAGSGNIAA
jgi:hypothetical protein